MPCGGFYGGGQPPRRPRREYPVQAGRFSERPAEADSQSSVGAGGGSCDDALAETTNGLHKAELIKFGKAWRTIVGVNRPPPGGSTGCNQRRIYQSCGDFHRLALRPPNTSTWKCSRRLSPISRSLPVSPADSDPGTCKFVRSPYEIIRTMGETYQID